MKKLFKCDVCFKESDDGSGWMYFKFKYLNSQNCCPDCVKLYVKDFDKLQEKGL